MPLSRASTRLVSGVVACLLLTACTGDPAPPDDPSAEPTPTPTVSASPSSTGPVTLRLGVYGDRTMRDAYEKLARVYTNDHPDVTVEVEASRSVDAAMDALDEQLATGTAPDLFVVPSEHAPRLSDDDAVEPVDELLSERGVLFGDNYLRLGLEAFSAEQHLQCMPFDVSPLVVVYNRGLLPLNRLIEEGEDPLTPETGWTWEQFARAARLMTRDGTKGVYVEPELSTLMALVRSGGADVVDDPREATTLTFSDEGTRSVLEDVLDVLREPRLTPTPRQLERKDALARFGDEQIGMMVATRAAVPELRRTGVDFDVFPLPRLGGSRTVADVTGFCMAAAGEHKEAAADFLAYAVGEKGSSILAETGAVVPAHVPTLNSLSFTQPGEQPESVLVFVDAVSRASLHPYVRGWPDVVDAVHPRLEGLFYDPVIDLDTLLPRIDEQSRQILARQASEQ